MPRQYTGGRKGLTKPYTLDRWSPATLSLQKPGSSWGSATGLWRMSAEHSTSCGCEKQQGQELPDTAPREEQVSAQPYHNTNSMTVVSPHPLNSQHK